MTMRNLLRFAGILTAGSLGLLAPGRAQAESIYSFNLQGNGVQVTGIVTVSDVSSGSPGPGIGEYLIETGSVTYYGPDSGNTTVPVSHLEAPGAFGGNDNFLLLSSPGTPGSGPFLDVHGVSFDISGYQENVYYSSGGYYIANQTDLNTSGGSLISSTMTVAYVSSVVPEPASLISVCTGGLLLGGFAWRKRRRTAIVA